MSSARINRTPLASAGGVASGTQLHNPRNGLVPPTVDPDLISYLREVFKVSLAPDIPYRKVDEMIGQQAVIEHLEALAREQSET